MKSNVIHHEPFDPRTKRGQYKLFLASLLAMNPNIIDMRNKICHEDDKEMTKEDFDRIERAKLKRERKAKKREDERIKRCQKQRTHTEKQSVKIIV